jgi:hypothetical protein
MRQGEGRSLYKAQESLEHFLCRKQQFSMANDCLPFGMIGEAITPQVTPSNKKIIEP